MQTAGHMVLFFSLLRMSEDDCDVGEGRNNSKLHNRGSLLNKPTKMHREKKDRRTTGGACGVYVERTDEQERSSILAAEHRQRPVCLQCWVAMHLAFTMCTLSN